MSNLKILHLLSSPNVGGSETLVINQILRSKNKNINYFLCCINGTGSVKKLAIESGIKFNSLDCLSILDYFGAFFKLKKYIYDNNIDIIHVYGFRCDLLARILKPHYQALVSAIHTVYTTRSNITFLIDSVTSNRVDRFISNSLIGRDYHATRSLINPNKICAVHSGVDINKFHNANIDYSCPDTINIVLLGTINKNKGHFVALNAIYSLIQQNVTNFVLTCVGRDDTNGNFLQSVNRLGLNRFVNIIGYCSNPKLLEVLKSSDIQILPSYSEGLPTAIMEGMSMQLPVIATKCGGITEIINDGINGILIESNNYEALTSAIKLLIQNNDLRLEMGKNARKTIEDNFSIDTMISEIEDIYQSIIVDDISWNIKS